MVTLLALRITKEPWLPAWAEPSAEASARPSSPRVKNVRMVETPCGVEQRDPVRQQRRDRPIVDHREGETRGPPGPRRPGGCRGRGGMLTSRAPTSSRDGRP